jgi:hypothetical protein
VIALLVIAVKDPTSGDHIPADGQTAGMLSGGYGFQSALGLSA